MMSLPNKTVIVGAGPVGCYGAARLCQSRLMSEVHVYEKQEKIGPETSSGRNVNITLCKRGLDALKLIDLIPGSEILPARQLTHFIIYTKRGKFRQPYFGDGLMSVKRNDLYHALHQKAVSFGANFRFGSQFDSILNKNGDDGKAVAAMFLNKDGHCSTETSSFLIGSDGVHSAVRKSLFENVVMSRYNDGNSLNDIAEKYTDSCVVLEHQLAYREISISQQSIEGSSTKLKLDTFHIWGSSGLIVLGLPSADGTLTLGVYVGKTELRQSTTEQLVQRIIESFPELRDILSQIKVEKKSNLSDELEISSVLMMEGRHSQKLLMQNCLPWHCKEYSCGKEIHRFAVHHINNLCKEHPGKQQFIQCKVGFTGGIGVIVKKGETLATYQAVKTMMIITSPSDGMVTEVEVSAGGQPVYTVEPVTDNQSKANEARNREESSTQPGPKFDPFDIQAFKQQLKTRYLGQEITYLETTGSTMDDAKSAAHQGCPSGSIFMAETMTKGRGRQGRVWTAPPKGNIYVTFLLRLPEKSSCLVQFAAALAVAKAVRSEGLDAKVKWPTDIWIRGHKVSGILVEADIIASTFSTTSDKQEVRGGPKGDASHSDASVHSRSAIFYLGIGINVNDDTRRNPSLRSMATSISSELFGEKVPRERVLANLCSELESALGKSMSAILCELEPYLLLKRSSEVKVTPNDEEEFTALVDKIDDLGRLHVRRTDTNSEVILSDLATSVRPSTSQCIYVYEGDGSSKQSVHMLYESLMTMCDVSKYEVKKISPEEIRQGSWVSSAAMLAIGGGFDIGYLRAFGSEGLQIIRDFIHAGGKYLGICAGAYLACHEIEFDKNGELEVCGPRSLKFFPGTWKQSASLLAVGGGFATGFIRALTEEGIHLIQDYVRSGGRFLGIGAGAYFGAQVVEFDRGGPQERCRSDNLLNFFPGKCIGPVFPGFVYNSEAGSKAAHIKWTSPAPDGEQETSWTTFVYYNGGGHFELECESDRNVELISHLLNSPDGELRKSVMKCCVGKGLAVLSGVHFEFLVEDLDENDQYLKSVVPELRGSVCQRDRFYMSVIEMLGL